MYSLEQDRGAWRFSTFNIVWRASCSVDWLEIEAEDQEGVRFDFP